MPLSISRMRISKHLSLGDTTQSFEYFFCNEHVSMETKESNMKGSTEARVQFKLDFLHLNKKNYSRAQTRYTSHFPQCVLSSGFPCSFFIFSFNISPSIFNWLLWNIWKAKELEGGRSRYGGETQQRFERGARSGTAGCTWWRHAISSGFTTTRRFAQGRYFRLSLSSAAQISLTLLLH